MFYNQLGGLFTIVCILAVMYLLRTNRPNKELWPVLILALITIIPATFLTCGEWLILIYLITFATSFFMCIRWCRYWATVLSFLYLIASAVAFFISR